MKFNELWYGKKYSCIISGKWKSDRICTMLYHVIRRQNQTGGAVLILELAQGQAKNFVSELIHRNT